MEYRLQSAKERLHSSQLLLKENSYKDSINRSYYAMFTAIRALFAMDGQDFSKHAGVISYFQKEYIKTGIFNKAKANGLKPYEYFEHLLTEIPKHLDDKDRGFLEDLLPWSPNLPANCRKSGKGEVK